MTTDLIEHNPMLKKPLLVILTISAQHANENRRALENQALETWDNAYSQSPTVCVNILARNGALDEQLFVNGELYEGTLEDLQTDTSVLEDAVAEPRISITDAGRKLLEAYAPDATLQALFTSRPHYHSIYETILNECNAEQGCSRAVLEQVINALPQLKPNPQTQQTAVYPQYFIDALESAGGIVWQGSWHTTDAGKTVVAA